MLLLIPVNAAPSGGDVLAFFDAGQLNDTLLPLFII